MLTRSPSVDRSRYETHHQPIRKSRPLQHLNIVRITPPVIGKVYAVAVPPARCSQRDERFPHLTDVPRMLQCRVAVDQVKSSLFETCTQFVKRADFIVN